MNENFDLSSAIAEAVAKAVQPLNDKLDAILSSTKQEPASQAQTDERTIESLREQWKAMAERLEQRGKC